jgi:alpha-L-fucosidase
MTQDTFGRTAWFREAAFGMFIHFGPYAAYGRGEQVLFREHLDQADYARKACRWNPGKCDPREWAAVARKAGMRYACLTTRHHDGYCLWDTSTTDYSSVKQKPRRDFVRDFVDACRAEGLRVGLYYSLVDWRIPAYWEGPKVNATGWAAFRGYVHEQVRELLTKYGPIDIFWFDGNWPHPAPAWHARGLMAMMRKRQPAMLINNRLNVQAPPPGYEDPPGCESEAAFPEDPGDFGTPEQEIRADAMRTWEACMTSTWRLWGYTAGERWHNADVLLDMLCQIASLGGNLILNVGPKSDGTLPAPFVRRAGVLGSWLEKHGEAIYGAQKGDVCEFITYGLQTRKGNCLYLIVRFWPGRPEMRLAGLATRVRRAVLLTTGGELAVEQTADAVTLKGLPRRSPTDLFPVIRLECDGEPVPVPWARERLWSGDPRPYIAWARSRGEGVSAGGP